MQRRQLLKRAAIRLFLHPPGGSGTAVSIIAACLNIASASKNKRSSSSFLKKCYGSQAPKNKSYGLSKHPQVSDIFPNHQFCCWIFGLQWGGSMEREVVIENARDQGKK